MAKSEERNKAIKLRQKGESIKRIAKILNVSKSSASVWCKDVLLTKRQIEILHKKMVMGSYAGRLIGSKIQHENRLKRAKEAESVAINDVGRLSDRDLLISLASLYWGEGWKKKRELGFNNSDPEMIKFAIDILRRLCRIEENRFILHVGINQIHKNRDGEVKDYWSKVTGVPKNQFRKTVFIKAKNKKKYNNFSVHYGTLNVRISRSSNLYYRMMGLIEGLKKGL